MKKVLIAALALALAALWGWRVYDLNHDPVVEYARRKSVEYAPGETVDLIATDSPDGWVDLTGYHMKITGARLANTLDLLLESGWDENFFERTHISPDYSITLLVDAVFWYDGEEDPQNKPVILPYFQVVGDSWSYWYSYELEEYIRLNPALEGWPVFAVVSGKEFEVTLPFLIKIDQSGLLTTSIGGITAEGILKSHPRLLVAEYPTQIYAYLPEITM